MLGSKYANHDKRGNSNKKIHRRVVTEMQEMPPPLNFNPTAKKTDKVLTKPTDKVLTKPKFLDVYSKYVGKNGIDLKKPYKIVQTKPLHSQKHLKTQSNEGHKLTLPQAQTQRPKVVGSKYQVQGVAGKGTFGVVYFGLNRTTGQKIAIKKVFQDKKYKNRQHTILKMLAHPNTLSMKDSYLTSEGDDEYLNIVMDYYPDNLYQVIKKKEISPILVKIYSYQILRGLNYLAMLSIAHRDIKPQNILVDKWKHKVVITDFGSAKQLSKNEANLAYICSRCYRAPQLIFGATDYTPQIDMWSTACCIVEMINGVPPFMGDSQIDQLIEIIKILGTPSKAQVEEMNKAYDMKEYNKFPKIKANPWKNILKTKDPLLIDLVTSMMQYSPKKRLTPAAALQHQYFDELRDQARYQQIMFKAKAVPELFDYSKEEVKYVQEVTGNKCELAPAWTAKKHVPLNLNKPLVPQTMGLYHRKPIVSTKAI